MKAPLTLLACLLPTLLLARTWTDTEGKTLSATYLSQTQTDVLVRVDRTGRNVKLPLTRLSPADIKWLASKSPSSAKSPDEASALPAPLAKLVAEKGQLVFSDDFNREDPDDEEKLGDDWKTNSKNRAQGDKQCDLVDGTLVLTTSPRADHSVTCGHDIGDPIKDLVVSLKFKLEKGHNLKLFYNDQSFKKVHAGHINGLIIYQNHLLISDEKSWRYNLDFFKKPETEESKKAREDSEKNVKIDLDPDRWHDIATHHNGDQFTVYIDGKEVASVSSPGYAHPTKHHFGFSVAKSVAVDDYRIWSLESE